MNPNKAPRYPLWSPKAILLISIPVILITALLVSVLSSRSILIELQITLSIIAGGLFLFLAAGLYLGVRLEKPAKGQPSSPAPSNLSSVPILDIPMSDVHISTVNLPKVEVDLPNISDAGDDLIGFLLTLVLWVVMAIAFVVAIWLIQQLLVLALPAIIPPLYWIFYRALRVVFIKSRVCRGRLGPSLGYSLLYTALYVGWLFVLLWISQYAVIRSAGSALHPISWI